jgi:ergothioneine biosynthesis protein EgtB
LGHTAWFFETFVLKPFMPDYTEFDSDFGFLFNSYYNNIGERVQRFNRGSLTRPALDRVKAYRAYVNEHITRFLEDDRHTDRQGEWQPILEVGLQHEQQHQELLWTDVKYLLASQPLKPAYGETDLITEQAFNTASGTLKIDEGLYEIGFQGPGFSFDNEHSRHRVFLDAFEISNELLTNQTMIDFIEAGGYRDFNLWHDEGWAWIQEEGIDLPLYWERQNGGFSHYTLNGSEPINPNAVLTHVSHYEAFAMTSWLGERLPTEFEWEVASRQLDWGDRWEHTGSAYLAYPGYRKAPGAIGEYNGKFMMNQMVLRGASCATSPNHSRDTYRNFFHPNMQWQYSGIRTVKRT